MLFFVQWIMKEISCSKEQFWKHFCCSGLSHRELKHLMMVPLSHRGQYRLGGHELRHLGLTKQIKIPKSDNNGIINHPQDSPAG